MPDMMESNVQLTSYMYIGRPFINAPVLINTQPTCTASAYKRTIIYKGVAIYKGLDPYLIVEN